jgi:phenylpyruvate tautomerase
MTAEAPCAYGELISIGAIDGEKNKQISAAIAAVLQQKLNVDPSRFYLKVSSSSSSSTCLTKLSGCTR